MTEYVVNRDKKDLITFMNSKAEKMGLQCRFEEDSFTVESKPGVDSDSQTPIPVIFKGRISDEDSNARIIGKFSYGFYQSTLVVIAAVLIIARLIWSLYQRQVANIVLCVVVSALLILVCAIARSRGKGLKEKIETFLGDLNKK